MDRRKDQIILVKQRHARLVAGRVRRIEREFGQETLPRGIAARDLFQLDQVGMPRDGILVDAFEMRFVPDGAPARVPPAKLVRDCLARTASDSAPGVAGARPGADLARLASDQVVQHPSGQCRPDPVNICITRNPATRSRGFSTKRSRASMSLMCAASRNLRPPNFTKGILRRVSSISSGPL